MTDLANTFLALPSPPLADLEAHSVSNAAALKCGGVRQGKRGWILPCYVDPPSCWHVVDDDAVVLDDFVVFHPDRPGAFRTVYNSGVAMLGESQFDRARFRPLSGGKPASHLRVFRDPLSWLRSGGAGVVPLDLPAFGRSAVGTSVRLIAEDLQHGEEIDRAIRAAVRFALPEIQVAA